MDFIEWCNNNNGFLTALLSLIGLTVSVIAVIVSIRTARLPYKKKLKLAATTNFIFVQDMLSLKVSSNISGISVHVTNLGSRMVNLIYLGLAVRDNNGSIALLNKINENMEGVGIINPTEIHSTSYPINDLLDSLKKLPIKTVIYLYATDSEGKIYRKKYGISVKIHNYLASFIKSVKE